MSRIGHSPKATAEVAHLEEDAESLIVAVPNEYLPHTHPTAENLCHEAQVGINLLITR